MISDETQYRSVTSQIADRLNRATNALKLFVQTFSAIVGGSIYLATGVSAVSGARPQYALLSNVAVTLLTFVCSIIVLEALRGWYGYRKVQAQLGGVGSNGKHNIPPPKLFPAGLAEIAMVIGMLAACGLFWRFNPFTLSN